MVKTWRGRILSETTTSGCGSGSSSRLPSPRSSRRAQRERERGRGRPPSQPQQQQHRRPAVSIPDRCRRRRRRRRRPRRRRRRRQPQRHLADLGDLFRVERLVRRGGEGDGRGPSRVFDRPPGSATSVYRKCKRWWRWWGLRREVAVSPALSSHGAVVGGWLGRPSTAPDVSSSLSSSSAATTTTAGPSPVAGLSPVSGPAEAVASTIRTAQKLAASVSPQLVSKVVGSGGGAGGGGGDS